MTITEQTFRMMLMQVADGNNGTTAALAKDLLKQQPTKIKLV
jgi:hypothetical protein